MFWVQVRLHRRGIISLKLKFDWIWMSALICLPCTCNSEWKQDCVTDIQDNNMHWQYQKSCISTFAIRNWRIIAGSFYCAPPRNGMTVVQRTLLWWTFLVPVSCLLGCVLKLVSSLFSLSALMIARAANLCRIFHFYSFSLSLFQPHILHFSFQAVR